MSARKITSLQNPLIKHLVKLREKKEFRESEQEVVVSGKKVIYELAATLSPKKIFLTEGETFTTSAPTYYVSEPLIKKMSGLAAPEGILATFPLPAPTPLKGKRLLLLENLGDPGNLGTLIRTALSFGWEGVYFLPHCVDPFHEKVVRASRGASLLLPYFHGTHEALEPLLNERKIIIADLEGTPLDTFKPPASFFLLLGSEAHGPSSELLERGERITIPMKGAMESLNVAVAGGILMQKLGDV